MNRLESTSCPDRDQLQQLLSGQTSDAEFSNLEAHLLQCERCAQEADALVPSADVTAMLSRAETQVFRTREAEQVEQLIRKVQALRSGASGKATAGDVEQTLIGANEAGIDRAVQGTQFAAGQTVAVDAGAVSFLRPAQQPDEIGRLGGYRILQVLGSGGMGVVYRAEDPGLKRLVALKVMKPTVAANPEAKARFMKEAEATAAIEHDNIVTIYQVGEDNGIPFIAMQFLKGESLQARLDRVGGLSEVEALRIGLEVANGLQAAHSRGLIHRDIKPDNIWLQEGSDRVRILDFGLVRNNAEDAGLTQSGVVLGTPRYMAPEQARGHEVDHRCDLFSLGSVMYRMLARRSPFEGGNLTATLIAVAHEAPQPLIDLAPDVSPGFAELIDRLLAKSPADRPASARDVAVELEQVRSSVLQPVSRQKAVADLSTIPIARSVSAEPVSAEQQPLAEKRSADRDAKPPIRRYAALFTGGIAAMILLAILIIRLRTKDGTIVIELDSAVPVTQVEIDGNQVKFTPDESGKLLTVSVPEGTHNLAVKTSDGISLQTELGAKPIEVSVSETTKVRAWLERSTAVAAVEEPKNDAAMTVEEPSLPKSIAAVPWPAGPFPAWASEEPRWSIMKESFTIPGVVERPSEFKSLGRWNVDTVQSRGVINVARYSPDGQWLATGSSDGHVRVYGASTMVLHQLLPGLSGQHGVVDLSWHPDSRKIAVAADNAYQLRIWTIDGQLLREELAMAAGETYSTINSVAWTFDGSRLICAGANCLEVRDSDGNLLKSLLEVQPDLHCNFGNVSVSPNSQRFVCWHLDKARIWNVETSEIEHAIDIPFQQGHFGHRVRWSSADRIALSLGDRLVICSSDGSLLKEFPEEPLCALAWRPNGTELTIWRVDPHNLDTESGSSLPLPGSRLEVWGESGPVPTAVDWSPDGKHLVVAAGRLAVCSESLDQIEFDTGSTFLPVSSVSMTPDGSQIASVSAIGDDCVRVWSAAGAAQRPMLLNERILTSPQVAWSPGGLHVAVGWPMSSHFRLGRPDGDFLTVAGSCVSLAWNPDGTQVAAGLTNGSVLIVDTNGTILHDVKTGETGSVTVAWSKHGTLVAHAGQKILRVNPESADSKISLLADAPAGPSGQLAVWRPDGNEVCISYDIHVNVADGVGQRIRRASPAEAWAPDGTRYLSCDSGPVSLRREDGSELLVRVSNASVDHLSNAAWSPSGNTIFKGFVQSLMVARNSEDLHVQWTAVILPKHKSVTFHVGGSVLDGDRTTLEREFAYYSADEKGNVRMLSLSDFEMLTGEEILPMPGRYFDSEYRFAISPGDDWKPASSDAFTVPGIARAAWSRPGGVSLNLFIQETGAYVDPSWLLNESARSQEEKLSATVLAKEVRQFAGRDAMWMIVEGQGTGTSITGDGPVKTSQHWIAIPRENDVLVALLTSPAGTFESSQKLFLKAMETLVTP